MDATKPMQNYTITIFAKEPYLNLLTRPACIGNKQYLKIIKVTQYGTSFFILLITFIYLLWRPEKVRHGFMKTITGYKYKSYSIWFCIRGPNDDSWNHSFSNFTITYISVL